MIRNKPLFKYAIGVTIFLTICILAKVGGSTTGKWYSILPPLIAVILAYTTQRIYLSLISGIVAGGFLVHIPKAPLNLSKWIMAPTEIVSNFSNILTDSWNLQILLFITFVMITISVVIISGGFQAVVIRISKYASSRKSTQISTYFMGIALFFDDYANTMIVGNSMRNLTDRYNVSREKLSFIVDATAAPICGLALVSTWIGYEVGLFSKVGKSLGIELDGYAMIFDTLPFRFYCISMIIFVLINIISGREFGPMALAEEKAIKGEGLKGDHGHPNSDTQALTPNSDANIHSLSAILPIGFLILSMLVGIWVDGSTGAKIDVTFAGLFDISIWRSVLLHIENTGLIFAISGTISLVTSILCAIIIAKISTSALSKALWHGLKTAAVPVVILLLAWSLKGACDSLDTGKFLASTLSGTISPMLFPSIIFILSGLVAFCTGTSWGTMSILIPSAIPIAYELDGGSYGLITMICLGSVLDGSIFGDHCSPISDTTIMSSTGCSCNHLKHVSTQMPYALTVASIATVCGYIPAALGVSTPICIATSVATICIIFMIFGKKTKTPS